MHVVVSDYNNKDMITTEESLHGVVQCVCQVFSVRPLAVSRAEVASCEFLNCAQWWGRHGHTSAAVPVPHWQLSIAIASRKLAESFKWEKLSLGWGMLSATLALLLQMKSRSVRDGISVLEEREELTSCPWEGNPYKLKHNWLTVAVANHSRSPRVKITGQ